MNPALPFSRSSGRFANLAKGLRKQVRLPIKLRQLLFVKAPRLLYRLAGIRLLDNERTTSFLAPYRLVTYPASTVRLPEVVDLAIPEKVYFTAKPAVTQPVSVWHYNVQDLSRKQLPYGSIVTRQQVLCLDVNTDDFYRNLLAHVKRTTRHTQTLIVPWSHYLDGAMWGGYYDFVLLVAGKLCRIKDALPESVFNQALVAYPLFGTGYEREYLALLGIDSDRIVDSRRTNVTFDACILADVGHWFYPNSADITALRKYVLNRLPPANGPRNRVYISRSCRRRILNEPEVIELLRQYDFQIIEDKPRSVAEQIAIYQQAEFIIGPHGASFTNILWCQPDTHLFELFSPTYFPDFFRYLAELLGLPYSAYFHGRAGTDDWAKGLEDDMYVSIEELERCLEKWL